LKAEDFAAVSQDDFREFAADFFKYSRAEAFGFCKHAIKIIPWLEPDICGFLLDPRVAVRFDAWCDAFAHIAPLVSPEWQRELFEFLHTLTLNEVQFGHIVLPDGMKEIQSKPMASDRNSAGQFRVDNMALPTNPLASFGLAAGMRLNNVCLTGWREVSALLLLAQPNEETLEVMGKAAEVHPRALSSTFAKILARFDDAVIDQWITGLLQGSQQRKMIALDILAEIGDRVRPLLLRAILKFVSDSRSPELLRCRALRAYARLRDADPDVLPELGETLADLRTDAEVDAVTPSWVPHSISSGSLGGEIPEFRPTPVVVGPQAKLPPLFHGVRPAEKGALPPIIPASGPVRKIPIKMFQRDRR
jgi:hypothetical protein